MFFLRVGLLANTIWDLCAGTARVSCKIANYLRGSILLLRARGSFGRAAGFNIDHVTLTEFIKLLVLASRAFLGCSFHITYPILGPSTNWYLRMWWIASNIRS